MTDSYPVSQVEIHNKVREIAINFIEPNIKVIDAAAGNGYMTQWLLENGAEVFPYDICPDDWKVPGVACSYSDFNKRIDAADGIFDLVISIETIEHLENPFLFIREIARVAKPGGLVIITTPNVHSVRSRIKYFFCGLPTLFEYIRDDHMGQHITPVSVAQFLYAFNEVGLTLLDIHTTGPKYSFYETIIFSLFNHINALGASRLLFKRNSDSDFYMNVLSQDQLKELNNQVSLIVVAQKK